MEGVSAYVPRVDLCVDSNIYQVGNFTVWENHTNRS